MKTVYFRDPTKENIEAAAKIIRDGGLLAIPTETVYGLGADALNEDAVLRIFLAKGRPQDAPLFTGICGESVTSQRAGRVAGPYRTPANPYFLASFERKAFLQQILNRSYSQIWCTITGGAYHSARRVTTCVRSG